MTAPPALQFSPAEVNAGPGQVLVSAMRDEIAALYEGLVLDGPDMPKAGPAELGPPDGAFIVGSLGGRPVCCGGVKRLDDRACEIKRMYVVPDARGAGLGRVLLHRLEDRARALGYLIARLDTGPLQAGARRIYESEGYTEVANFNANPVASFWGEKLL